VAHLIEEAKSSRATCRSCKKPIAKGELRFGEETINAFAGGGTTHVWHHLSCAAEKKPLELKDALAVHEGPIPDKEALERTIAESAGKKKPAFPYVERAPTGRSRCIGCQEAIAKGELRVAVEREVDTGSFVTKGAGYLHPRCARGFLGQEDLLDKAKANSRLDESDSAALAAEVGA
jgi:poly [ADP-ribose] polymerase